MPQRFTTRLLHLFLAGACLASLASCSQSDNKATSPAEEAAAELPMVNITKVYKQDVMQRSEYTATVEAFKTNNISSSTSNRIKSILVDVGARVARGQKLVVLDDVNIEQMRVRLENLEREYNRARQLLEIGAGTQQAVDQQLTELEAQRRQYTNLMENTVLTSPITGVVTARNYDPGDMTGQLPILTIEQVQPVKVIVNVSESDFPRVHKGMNVSIKLDVYGEEQFGGTVYLIHPTIDPSTRTFTVEITINNADNRVLPGMFARVTMDFGHADRVVVPDRAVVKQTGSGNRYVYVYHPDTRTVSYNKVELGQRLDDAYELISGVEAGSDVVITGQQRLADGVEVNAVDKQAAATAPADSSAVR